MTLNSNNKNYMLINGFWQELAKEKALPMKQAELWIYTRNLGGSWPLKISSFR
jgi:hypothetical protein